MTITANMITIMRQHRYIIRDMSFTVNAGDIIYVKGANGVGKSTLLRTMAGLLPLHNGDIIYNDDIPISSTFWPSFFWYMPTYVALREELTLLEHIYISAKAHDIAITPAQITAITEQLGLYTIRDKALSTYSQGQKRRAQLSALLLEPRLLWLLDEVFLDLDTHGINWLHTLIKGHQEAGNMVMFVQHHEPILPHTQTILL